MTRVVRVGSTTLNRGHAAIAIIGCSFCLGGHPWRWVQLKGAGGP